MPVEPRSTQRRLSRFAEGGLRAALFGKGTVPNREGKRRPWEAQPGIAKQVNRVACLGCNESHTTQAVADSCYYRWCSARLWSSWGQAPSKTSILPILLDGGPRGPWRHCREDGTPKSVPDLPEGGD